ncbi:uncharacterized protein LOC113056059 [Carassius auratus]|uniref:Uncharacterized protein LOC113056059 n=1 Tax=Carassius auratus TaxID=7957 RepID=A0A6P6L193_CARAU|nr:uncharacterized protein LOC113056059 [Carassius auratus]XP_026078314.1 uncharacterized protein LOC113056059 [Carassius auratus]
MTERPSMETTTVLRVIICDNDIRKIVLPVKPQTVDSLLEQLEEKLGLQYKFALQFEDPDFNNSLVNLTNIADLPDKPTLKIVSLVTSPTPSTADTEVLSVASDHPRHCLRTAWPETFEIPTFPVDVEYRLRQGNLQYMRDQTYLQLSGELKHEILEKLSETIYSYKAYPDKEDFEAVATALIQKHPCLTQPGSSKGWNGWYDSLRWKMGNYRSKLRRAGCLEVSINGGKRRGLQPQRNIKRPKRFEINFLPNFPDGEDEASMESKRKEMVEEMKKRRLNVALIARNMNSTFALRRKELIEKEPAVKNTVERWPALFTQSQIMAEFNRISGKNLQAEFFQELDRFTPLFIDIFRAKGGDIGSKLKKILQQIENDKSNINAGRTAVLHGLPLLLGEDPSDFYKTCFDCDDNEDMSDVEIGILTVIPEDSATVPYSLHLGATTTAIILEGTVVVDDLENLPQATCLLFGLIYALNLEYPAALKCTFDFIQRVILSLGHKSLKPKIQSLKNRLMQ